MTMLDAAPAPADCPHPDHRRELVPSTVGGWCVDCRGWWDLPGPNPGGLVRFRLVLPRGLGYPPAPAQHVDALLGPGPALGPDARAGAVERLTSSVRAAFTARTGRPA